MSAEETLKTIEGEITKWRAGGSLDEAMTAIAKVVGKELGSTQMFSLFAHLYGTRLDDLEKTAILNALNTFGGSTSKASKALGISVRKIQYRMRGWRQAGEVMPTRRFVRQPPAVAEGEQQTTEGQEMLANVAQAL